MGGTSILTCGPSGVGVEPVPATLTKHHRCNAAQFAYQVGIEAAAYALQKSEQPIAAIATQCSFNDQAAFSRQFRATTGLTPRDYRKAFQSSVQ